MTFNFTQEIARAIHADTHVARLVYREVRRQLDFAFETRQRIERKAQSLFTLSSLILLASFALSYEFTDKGVNFYLFALVGVLNAAASFLSLLVLYASPDTVLPTFDNLFNVYALNNPANWYQYIIPHVVELVETQERNNTKRAILLKFAQIVFAISIFFSFVLCVKVIAVYRSHTL